MALTYVALATVTVGSGGAASMEFTSIPQTYTDLVIKFSIRTSRSNITDSFCFYFNGDTTGGRYPARMLYADGANAYSYTSYTNWDDQYTYVVGNTATASTFGNGEFYIPNYVGSNSKSVSADSVGENNATTAFSALGAIRYTETSAITSITLDTYSSGGTISQYSTATLYGIKNS